MPVCGVPAHGHVPVHHILPYAVQCTDPPVWRHPCGESGADSQLRTPIRSYAVFPKGSKVSRRGPMELSFTGKPNGLLLFPGHLSTNGLRKSS